jgi:hypothetical protein
MSSYKRTLEKLESVQVRVIGILPVDEAALPAGHVGVITNAKIAEIDARLSALCRSYPNCEPVTEIMHMDMTGLTDGGIHPKREAYKKITTILAKYAEIEQD